QNGDGGSDTITSGAGNDEILAGAGADSIVGGDGNNRILGDSGSYDGVTLTSALNAGDGNDTVTAGTGNDWAILGQGDDTANLGTGNNRVLADSGRITATLVTSTENAEGGNDSITTGSGNDVILAGAGSDTVTGGDGDNVVLGDAGSLEETEWTLTSALTDGDGNDIVTTGTGNDWVILGQGDDDANLGAGNNRAIGDSGVIVDTAALTLDTTSILDGGNDTIRSTGGDDILIGGASSDLVEAGNGNNTVLGDNGNVTYDPAVTAGMTSVTTVTSTAGAADTLETGDGRDVILGGEGGDSITAGAGADLVLGDQGVVTGSSAARFGSLTSLINEVPGDDVIDLGAGNDVALGGLGNDSVYAGQGEDMVLGDSGLIRFSGLSAIEEIVLLDQDRGGNDFITAAGVGGDNILVGQFGADTVEGGTDDDVILGDFATFTFLPGAAGYVGQSSADRMQVMTSIRVDLSFNDVLQGDLGSDFMLGGMGDDLLYGDAGQDFMIGDMIIFTRTWEAGPFGSIFEETTVDTNFAFVTGGYDQFFSGEGPDVMIGGLGPDLFFGNTEFDLIYSDAYAGLFYATWADGFTGDTPQRFLIKSNFAGPGAIDVVSESQQNSSIGSPLDLRNLGFNAAAGLGDADAMDRLSSLLAGSAIPHMASMVIDILGSYDIVKAISALVAAGIDAEVLVDALLNEVMQQLLAMDSQNLIVAEIMIERMIRLYLAQAGLLPAAEADTDDDQANASDDGARLWKIAAE
ncbi:MAG: calcium-binding protein, partial [Rhodobacterales bacterium]